MFGNGNEKTNKESFGLNSRFTSSDTFGNETLDPAKKLRSSKVNLRLKL